EQRWDDVGYASGGYHETPVLDALAARGARFDAAYSGSTVCVPSRTSLLTGLAYHRVEHEPGSLALRPGYLTLARALRAAGYRTELVGKMHFSPMRADHGFDRLQLAEHLVPYSGYGPGELDDYHRWLVWQGRAGAAATHMFGPGLEAEEREYVESLSAVTFPHPAEYHPIGWVAARATEVLRTRAPGQPLFLVVSFPRPHAPYDPAEPYASRFRTSDARIPASGFEANDVLPRGLRERLFTSEGKRHRMVLRSELDDARLRRLLTNVRALVTQLDVALGEVLAALDPQRALVFYTSDHGCYGGARGLVGKVPWVPFDDLARVPFVCAAPGGQAGVRVAAPTQSHDLVATALDYAGIDAPAGLLDSVSLRGLLEGGVPDPGRAVFTTGAVVPPMVRRGQHKLLHHAATGEEVLFDLAEDPGELRDRSGDPSLAGVRSELRHALRAHLERPRVALGADAILAP
ncbi:MAG: sulfatase-like hydrolase/transferase, partial [Deltaproteobacteria bacterium]|nr:sulfatase-like hydrolase/transferase [Deltaproteobacteria bacterium]